MIQPEELRKIRLAHKNMLSRCYNENDHNYPNYGGRGISVCYEWKLNREDFMRWAVANGHAKNLTLDRIDVNGNYEPSNCRWITIQEQLLNQRRNHVITFNGKSQPLAVWAREIGVGVDTLFRRIKVYQMPIDKALTPGSLKDGWEHGTRAGYEGHGCRCDLCRESNNARHRKERARRKAERLAALSL